MNYGKLLEYIDHFPQQKIAVAGDLMLDMYFWGDAKRISPEAPVPVVNVKRITRCLGGAGNVMRNIATLGGHAMAFGMAGTDEAGSLMEQELDLLHIERSGMSRISGRRTTEKQRVLAGHQQLLRLDLEETSPAPEELRQRIVEQILSLIRQHAVDAVIFEDYRKGLLSSAMLQAIVPEAVRCGVITALDPKPGSMEPVPGLTVIKPNRQEAFLMAGMDGRTGEVSIDDVAAELLRKWQPEYLLISLAQDGMALYRRNSGKTVIPTRAREVFDVSGAGDTVVASFCLAMASGAAPEEAAEISNYAAGIVVGKVGTSPVSAAELLTEIKDRKKI